MDFETLVAALTPVRVDILNQLIAQGPMSMGALADALGLSPSSMTEHVNCLIAAGLAQSGREGRSVIVASRVRGLELVIDWCD